MIPFGLFSNSLTIETKDSIKKIMLETETSFCQEKSQRGYGKPSFPKYHETTVTDLPMFAGTECWRLFSILGISSDFSKIPCYGIERFTII